MEVKAFFDKATFTLTYCLFDVESNEAALIDPVLNFDPVNSQVQKNSLQEIMSFLEKNKLDLKYVIETHVHADHWTAAHFLKAAYPKCRVAISHNIQVVTDQFSFLFHGDAPLANEVFDILVDEKSELPLGGECLKFLETPGHTPCCMCIVMGDKVFVGDLMFMPDSGTGRCDFPGGDALQMYESISQKIYTLPDTVELFTGHDYQPGGRELQFKATVKEHKDQNVRLNSATTLEDFLSFRKKRDETLNLPKLIFSSLQVNLRSGDLGPADAEGRRFLTIPFWES